MSSVPSSVKGVHYPRLRPGVKIATETTAKVVCRLETHRHLNNDHATIKTAEERFDHMSTPQYTGPIPIPTPETKPFWDGAKQHKLMIQRCRSCKQHYFYPRPLCPHCLSREVEWVEATGRGKLHTYVINHRAPRQPPIPPPFILAIVELDEGPRMMTNVVGTDPDPAKLPCDAPVEVVFDDVTPELTLPRFRLVNA